MYTYAYLSTNTENIDSFHVIHIHFTSKWSDSLAFKGMEYKLQDGCMQRWTEARILKITNQKVKFNCSDNT